MISLLSNCAQTRERPSQRSSMTKTKQRLRRPAGRDLPGIELPHLCDMIRACSHSCRCLYTCEFEEGGPPLGEREARGVVLVDTLDQKLLTAFVNQSLDEALC